jgi:hypothetical protein
MKYKDIKGNTYFENNGLEKHDRKSVFDEIYDKDLWQIPETKSGVASQAEWVP